MDLNYEEIKDKMCKVVTRFYYSNSKEISLSPNEKLISQIYIPWRKDYYIITKEFQEYNEIKNKECNFISKIRQLTEDNKPKTFSQKHDYLARKISEAAERGYNSCRFCLSEEEVEDLRAEGFIVEYNGYREYSTISW